MLDLVAEQLGRLRRTDLAALSQPAPVDAEVDADERRQVRRDRLNARKKALTGQSSARWANAIIAGNDDQYRLARDAQYRHIAGLRTAIATIEARLAEPTSDRLTVSERKARRSAKAPKGYATQGERFQKLRRVQHLRGKLAAAERDRAAGLVRVLEGGKSLARLRHNLDRAGLTEKQWRHRWDTWRWRIRANGSPDEPFGNLTITVTPAGQVSIRLPKPLDYLANAARGRYILSRVLRCSPTAAGRGRSGSPVATRSPTSSPVNPAGPGCTSLLRGRSPHCLFGLGVSSAGTGTMC